MTRILTLTNWYPPHHYGGYELSCFDVMTRLAARGHDVRVLCSDDRHASSVLPNPDHEQVVHRELRVYAKDGEPWRPPVRTRLEIERHNRSTLEHHLLEHDPEVVAVWQLGALSLGLLRCLTTARLPIVYAVCDDWLTYGEELDAWSRPFAGGIPRIVVGRMVEVVTGMPTVAGDIGNSGAFCFVSESTRRRAVADGRWAYPVSTVVYSGIDRREFTPISDPAERRWRWRLLYTGRFDPRKGIETLVRALPLLPPQATLECYGRGGAEERSHLAKTASELGVGDRVAFDALERHELAARYCMADVLVFPSEWEEPFGLVPVEAMACATPVVATGTGGSAEFLRDRYNCLIFHPGDADGLAAAVRRLHDDVTLRERVVRGGLQTAEEFDVERLTDVFEEWYVAAVDGFTRGLPADRRLDLPDAGGDPLVRHQTLTPHVIEHGDDDAIKHLYVTLGEDWWQSRTTGGDDVPVLSAPETHDVVTACFDGVIGLVFDAGCGPNPAISIALGRDPRRSVVSLDIGWGTVRVARELANERGVSLIGVVGDLERLPFRDSAFDALACDDTIEHLPDDAAGVGELARVLQPDGLAVLATPNREDARVVRAKVRDRLLGVHKPATAYYCSNSHLREYTWAEFERLLQPAFRVRARHPVGWKRGWKSKPASVLVQLPGLHRFSQMIVLEATPG